MIRIACVALLAAAMAAAQESSAPATAPAANALEQALQQKTDDWNRLAQPLESQLIRLLPCDPKAAAAITQVSRASGARLAALAAYLDDAIARAAMQAESAKKILERATATQVDLTAEKEGFAAEREGLERQITNLTQAAQGKAAFVAAQDQLKQISVQEQQRASAIDTAASHAEPALDALRELVAQLDKRRAAWVDVQKAFAAEREYWNAYYAARLARTDTECSITQRPAPPRPQGKQK